jgi:hypothetical protein
MDKLVCQLNDSGYYVGQVFAQESPLEPGLFLIPAGAVDIYAPVIPENKFARYENSSWVFEDARIEDQILTEEPKKQDYSALRLNAYHTESDPLFFKAQRGEATIQDWLDKVAQIKERYPDNTLS